MSVEAAFGVPLHERHAKGGTGWLDNMEEKQQHDYHQRDA